MSTREEKERILLLQGTLDLLILRTLVFGPQHGLGIARAIQKQSDEVLLVDHGSLYPALQRLEDRGWIAAKWGVSDSSWLSIRRMRRETGGARCETSHEPILIPPFLAEHLRAGDEICAEPGASSPACELLARRSFNGRRSRQLYFSRIGCVTQPKSDKRDQYFVRAEVVAS
jgi:hypothetical protein